MPNMYMVMHDSKNPTLYLQPDVALRKDVQTPDITKLGKKTSHRAFRKTAGTSFGIQQP